MTTKVSQEQGFQVLATNFSIGPTTNGYTLQVSADGRNFSDLFSVDANTTRMVTSVASGSYYRLKNNTDDNVVINWQRQCNDGGSGGGSGAQGPQGPAGGGDSAQTMALISAAINANNENLEEGEPIVGMAKQLYSPDGTTSDGTFAYRTTAGDEDVSSGPANLMKVMGNAAYPQTEYNDSAVLMREGSEVEGFDAEFGWGELVPNDIPYGESTYTYDGSDWTPSLPEAMTAMTLNSETYSPESGDEIVITRTLSKTGSASYPQPHSFVALGLNSFSKDGSPINSIEMDEIKIQVIDEGADYNLITNSDYAVYVIKAVTGLSNGYVVYHKSGSSISWAGVYDPEEQDIVFSATIRTSTYDVVYPTAEFPYIVFSARKDEEGMICVHPRWSGYMDEEYEDYSESVLDIHSFNAVCPLVSVGSSKNVWDFENGKLIKNIDVIDYSAQAVQDLIDGGKTLGTDFDFDEYHIYEVSNDPVETSITFDNSYDANDFSVEYFTNENDSGISAEAAGAETYYMQNLVDKLRRMESYFVHLDNLDGDGETGMTYEYNGVLMVWNESDGNVAEWLKVISSINDGEGTGLIYSVIPDGQKLFEYKYNYGGDWRIVTYSNGTLYCTETGGTLVASATTNQTFSFQTSQYGNIYQVKGIVKNGYIGFRRAGHIQFQNVWNGSVSGGHYELIDKYNYPYTEASEGVPVWNENGQIIRKMSNVSSFGLQFNTNASQYSSTGKITMLTDGTNNGPSRIFVPTAGGTSGQVLISQGDNAAPIFTSWIKSVQITSDAYEALQTKDQNTLYLIVDE